MIRRIITAMALTLGATPAFATGGFDCRTTERSNIMISGTIGRVVGSPLVAAHLRIGQRTLGTTDRDPQIAIARSWIDSSRLWVDLADAQVSRLRAQLRVTVARGRGTGTLILDGVRRRVRCEIE